mgnify:CR=1 FL=1
MSTLYELTNDWMMLMEMAEDPDSRGGCGADRRHGHCTLYAGGCDPGDPCRQT